MCIDVHVCMYLYTSSAHIVGNTLQWLIHGDWQRITYQAQILYQLQIMVNTLQAMYKEDVFKLLAPSHCSETKIRQEDTQLVYIQEVEDLLGDAITCTMVTLTSVWQKLQHAMRDLRQDLVTDVVLASH